MCMQDVKLGRAKTVLSLGDDNTPEPTGTAVGKHNPDRAAYLLSAHFEAGAVATDRVVLYSGSAAGPVVAVLTPYNPNVVISVEVYGDAAVQRLVAVAASAANVVLSAAEAVWTETLESAVANQR